MQRIDIAKIVLKNGEGKYLILRGSVWPERPDRSQKPDLPGGLVDAGENHLQAAVREMQEEAGITISESDLRVAHAESFITPEKDKAVNRIIYRIDVGSIPEVTISWEHEGYWWMNADEVRALEIREPYREIFNYLHKIGELK